MNTRRHPRTLVEAFGPYTSNTLHPMPDSRDYSPRWWFAMGLIAIATILAVAIFH